MFRNVMKRSFSSIKNNITEHNYDAIVIGAGGAGLRATMGLAEKGYNVACISKQEIYNLSPSYHYLI